MRHVILLVLASATLSAQWATLPNTTFDQTVCAANGTNSSTCTSGDNVCGGSTAIPYNYKACYSEVIIAYSGGVGRTKKGSEQLVLFGGGHADYGGNEVYAINVGSTPGVSRLTAPSHIDQNDYYGIGRFLTSSGTAITVNTSGTSVTWVSGPQNFTAACTLSATDCWVGHQVFINGTTYLIKSVNSPTSLTLYTSAGNNTGATLEVASGWGFATRDGRPVSSHSYNNMSYVDETDPTFPDSMFLFGGAVYGGGTHSDVGWLFNFATNTWKMILPDPSGFKPNGPIYIAAPTFYDSASHLIWLIDNGNVVSLDLSTCTGTGPITCTYKWYSASATAIAWPGAAYDTKRHRIVAMGAGSVGSGGVASTIDLTGAYGTTNITSMVDPSCANVMNAVGPGMVYVPSLDQIVAYPSDSAGTIYVMNPATFTCSAATYSGGPAVGGVVQGHYGRLQYFPTLGTLVTLNAPGQAAYALSLSASPTTPPSPPNPTSTTPASSIWSNTITPTASFVTSSGVNVGVKFRSDTAGSITGIRFYKDASDNGTHIASLYRSTGTLLAQATFSGETASGWQQVSFGTAVPIAANTTYVAALYSSSGFVIGANYFTSNGANNAPLHALQSGIDGGNGVYAYGSGPLFPSSTYADANYWVDVTFGGTGSSPSPLTLSCASASGQVGTAYSSALGVSGGVPPYTDSIISGALPVGLALNSSTSAITGTPSASGTYNYTGQVVDSAGSKVSSGCSIVISSAPSSPPPPPPPLPSTLTASGLGHSTYNCIDIDGDGYGTGPGCVGPDADDLDPAVHTGNQAVTKWGSLKNFITSRLHYTPRKFWYVSPTGNDSATCTDTDGATNIGTPCQTIFYGVQSKGLAAGDIVIFRGGTYPADTAHTFNVVGGSAGSPIVYMAYPGERPLLTATINVQGSGPPLVPISWFVLDGFAIQGPGSIGNAIGGYVVDHGTFRHLDMSGWLYAVNLMNGVSNVSFEESVVHDNWEHGIYLGARGFPNSNITVQRNIIFNNGWTGVQHNGRVTNLIIQNNWMHSNDLSPISFENGVSYSIVRSNLLVNNGRVGILFGLSDPGPGLDCSETGSADLICPHNENYNVIENNTFYNSGFDRYGNIALFGAIQVGHHWTDYPDKDCGHNTFRNNIMYAGPDTGHTPVRQDYQRSVGTTVELGWWSTNIWDHNIVKSLVGGDPNVFETIDTDSTPEPTTIYTRDQFAKMTTLINNAATDLMNVDPQFVDVSTAYYNQPGKFNFSLAAASPAIHAGSATAVPATDVIGNVYAPIPSLGGVESGTSSPSVPTNTCDLSGDGVVNSVDVQLAINQALGISACGTASLEGTGLCSVVDVQRVINASLGGTCKMGQ